MFFQKSKKELENLFHLEMCKVILHNRFYHAIGSILYVCHIIFFNKEKEDSAILK